ncbi:MAG: type I 3-dehydroquinate dehydratase [Aquificaceae bacterium]|nr:type I 3-dehydroquinate dehydratase [Aquificaceae bacterium]MCX8059654.1 type I 3-dehydroquinate dehydratase [Aquificaceae bacterium]MDW8096690.1 type I 3-dehydroquinate dehydratase [Aquificaceae bacterium]
MLIAVPLSDKDLEKNLRLCKEKGADLVELRVDLFENRDSHFVLRCVDMAHQLGLMTILTVRSEKEGGSLVENRAEVFRVCSPHSDYTDIELSSQSLLPEVKEIVKGSGKKLIVSYHHFELTPPNWILKEVFREAKRWGADVVKVAVKANSYEDTARLLCLGKEQEGEKILVAMGEYGKASRVAGFVFGSVITYAYVGSAVAPGQLSLEEALALRKLLF